MKQPPGFVIKNKVCHLKRAIYGLPRSSKDWNEVLHTFLLSLGFVRSKHNYYCLYTHIVNGKFMIVLIYVDDGFISAENDRDLFWFKSKLSKRFKISDTTN